MRNPERFAPYVAVPLLTMVVGSIARTGYEIFQDGRIVQDMVGQYFDGPGDRDCLANSPYDVRGVRQNISVQGVAHIGPTTVHITPSPLHPETSDTLHLQYIGDTDGGLVLGPADHMSATILKAAGCPLPEGS